jgi:hypothetical protein
MTLTDKEIIEKALKVVNDKIESGLVPHEYYHTLEEIKKS